MNDKVDQKFLNQLATHKISRITDNELFHYTSIASMKSIIENKQFWVTRADFLNDPSEIIYFGDFMQQIIEDYRETQSISADWLNGLYNYYGTSFRTEYPSNYYVLSLSTDRDSLAMWNYYGKNDGYNIGIDSNRFLSALKNSPYKFFNGSVIYDSEHQKKIITDELKHAHNYWISSHHQGSAQFASIMINSLMMRFSVYALFFKHNGYRVESEYRIVFINPGDFDVHFRTDHGVFTPYIVIPTTTTENEEFPLHSVTIGPLIKHEYAKKGLSEWLRKNNHHKIDIYVSNIPLRF